jgi:hypothetical protein
MGLHGLLQEGLLPFSVDGKIEELSYSGKFSELEMPLLPGLYIASNERMTDDLQGIV